jgi:hypothetical protein
VYRFLRLATRFSEAGKFRDRPVTTWISGFATALAGQPEFGFLARELARSDRWSTMFAADDPLRPIDMARPAVAGRSAKILVVSAWVIERQNLGQPALKFGIGSATRPQPGRVGKKSAITDDTHSICS